MPPEVAAVIAELPIFAGVDPATLEVTRLGGLTNRNYALRAPNGHFVLRLAGEGTGEYIDREAEAVNARIAAEAGVNAEVLHFDARTGTMLTRFIEGGTTMSAAGFRDLGAVRRAGVAFRRLHECGKPFRGRFELFDQIDNYLGVVRKLGAPLPQGYAEVQREAEAVRAALGRHELPLRPCHCDPLAENFLDTGERVYIIDFEYAGNNDPMWDLGDLSVEAGMGPAAEAALLEAYFGAEPPAFDAGRAVLYKAMCDLLWTLWGVVQLANDNPAEDFRAYADGRLQRCRRLMATPAFAQALAAVEAHPAGGGPTG